MTKRTKEGKGMGDVLYISLVLDKESRMRLIKKTKRYSPDWKNGNVIAEYERKISSRPSSGLAQVKYMKLNGPAPKQRVQSWAEVFGNEYEPTNREI